MSFLKILICDVCEREITGYINRNINPDYYLFGHKHICNECQENLGVKK